MFYKALQLLVIIRLLHQDIRTLLKYRKYSHRGNFKGQFDNWVNLFQNRRFRNIKYSNQMANKLKLTCLVKQRNCEIFKKGIRVGCFVKYKKEMLFASVNKYEKNRQAKDIIITFKLNYFFGITNYLNLSFSFVIM